MHTNKVIHRDLKLGNLFLNENMEIKIGDFGLATTLSNDDEKKFTVCGTPNYIAPETLKGKAEGHSYEVDNWAIGVIIYTLIFGKPPFETDEVKDTYKKIQNNDYSFPETIYSSGLVKDLIKKLLVNNPTNRLTLEGIVNHDFMIKTLYPKSLPISTLSVPPSTSLIRQTYLKNLKIKVGLNDISKYYEWEKNNIKDMRDFALDKVIDLTKQNICPTTPINVNINK